MPRLTDHTYSTIYQELHSVWVSDPTSIFLLNALEQRALHEYFRFSESLTGTHLIEHRRVVSAENPSLLQRAGRAFRRLHLLQPALGTYVAARQAAPVRTKNTPTNMAVFAEVRPDIDPEQIAKILIDVMYEHLARERSERAASSTTAEHVPDRRR